MSERRKTFSAFSNLLIGAVALFGTVLACALAKSDGYSHWTKRLLYFTQQSNIWIGVTCLAIGVVTLLEVVKGKTLIKEWLYLLKYIFTVSITITGIIFCALLAPFSEENIWSFSSVVTHVVVPVAAIADYFLCENIRLKKRHVFLALLPPLFYFLLSICLSELNVDFGKGEPYPYFFMNFHTEVGWFGFKEMPTRPLISSFYWIAVILLLILALSWAYYALHPVTKRNKGKKKSD